MKRHHDLPAYIGVLVIVLIVTAVGLWAGGFPSQLSRFM